MATEDKGSVPSEKKIEMPKDKSKWPNTPANWIKLLGTPLTIFLATGGLFWQVIQFNAQQSTTAQMQATQVALTQAQALDQQRQAILDTYLDRISDLLLMDHLRTNSDAQALVRFEAIYGNTCEAIRGSAFSPEASLEQAGSKQRETDV